MRLRSEKGIAVLEAAVWSSVLLPCFIFAASLGIFVHDQRIVSILPEALLRESAAPGLRWVSDGSGGSFNVDNVELEGIVTKMAVSGRAEATANVFHAKQISSRACYWIYGVRADTGLVGTRELESCQSQGAIALTDVLNGMLTQALKGRIGVPIEGSNLSAGYVERIVLIGVAIGGQFSHVHTLFKKQQIEFAHVSFPRREVTL